VRRWYSYGQKVDEMARDRGQSVGGRNLQEDHFVRTGAIELTVLAREIS